VLRRRMIVFSRWLGEIVRWACQYGVCTRKGNSRALQLQRLKCRMFLDVARVI
jgi:hypothetical protein